MDMPQSRGYQTCEFSSKKSPTKLVRRSEQFEKHRVTWEVQVFKHFILFDGSVLKSMPSLLVANPSKADHFQFSAHLICAY